MGFKTIKEMITPILESKKQARCDDMYLYMCYLAMFKIKRADVVTIFSSPDFRRSLNIIPYDSIGRIRRKIQSERPELRATPEQIKEKLRAEREYREYVKEKKACKQ